MQQQQSNQGQNQQPMYQQPPNVITGKDFNYLTDMLSWNLLGFKKAHFAASQCQDQKVSTALEKACHMHEKHYQQILQKLQSGGSQNMNQ
ncbi:hypothetical protein [Fictibacillus sp. KU28468]|uniref:hypothetical protein n=1 Tax=Fictibacillus sp. KU28468 TaxID=2991053 RepID=UPI00223CB423|nr:hypothetical protein [Fictibacillus sp. KU28468]UZJ80180.1 hypothetical protein OKX00_06870 [Fictibacillus sp. KU28468]